MKGMQGWGSMIEANRLAISDLRVAIIAHRESYPTRAMPTLPLLIITITPANHPLPLPPTYMPPIPHLIRARAYTTRARICSCTCTHMYTHECECECECNPPPTPRFARTRGDIGSPYHQPLSHFHFPMYPKLSIF